MSIGAMLVRVYVLALAALAKAVNEEQLVLAKIERPQNRRQRSERPILRALPGFQHRAASYTEDSHPQRRTHCRSGSEGGDAPERFEKRKGNERARSAQKVAAGKRRSHEISWRRSVSRRNLAEDRSFGDIEMGSYSRGQE